MSARPEPLPCDAGSRADTSARADDQSRLLAAVAQQPRCPAARREWLRKLATFGSIGMANLVLYLIVYGLLTRAGLSKIEAGALAFASCTVVSYLGNKTLTFRSTAAHAEEAPRFAVTSILGAAIATFGPSLLVDTCGLSEPQALAIVCILVPLQNFLLMNGIVFRNAGSGSPEHRIGLNPANATASPQP